MAGATNSVEGVLAYFMMSILTNIVGEPTRKALIKLHRIIIGNAASVALNLGGGRHVHLELNMTTEDYLAQTGHVFVLLLNPYNYPPMMGTTQEQVLGTRRF